MHKSNEPVIHESQEAALKAAGLDIYATSHNEKIIEESEKQLVAIRKELGNKFGGTWLEYDENNQVKLIVAVAGDTSLVQSKKYSSAPDQRITFTSVVYGLNYLNSLEEKIAGIFRVIKQDDEQVLLSVGVDEKNNKIIARGRKQNLQYILEVLQRSGIDANIINIEEQDGPINFMGTVYGGTKIGSTNDSMQGMYLCTTGFNVIIDGIYPGSLTAAHCYNYDKALKYVHFNLGSSPTGSVKGPQIGEYLADGWPDAMDTVIFGNTNFVHTLPPQYRGVSGSAQNVKPLAEARISSTACTSGGSNGWRCGTLITPRIRHMIDGREFFFAEFTACGGQGDSGGPVVSNSSNALGIYVGAVGTNLTNTCGSVFGGGSSTKSVYQPLGPYLNKYNNVKIITN